MGVMGLGPSAGSGTCGRFARLLFIVLLLALVSCTGVASRGQSGECFLRLATTTSTENSGLLKAILPDFEARYRCRVEVIAVGTGQALALGRRGDADVLLVHAKAREAEFVAEGHATARYDVMYNDFVIVGPPDDPAGVKEAQSAAEAFRRIAEAQAPFVSRGDDSGTHIKERAIWAEAGLRPSSDSPWYYSVGKGMGPTLIFANEKGAYTLTDRGTYLSMRKNLPGLVILFGGETIAQNPDPMLHNPYGVLPVNPEKHPGVNYEMAMKFVEWITSPETQAKIGAFGKEEFGQSLFYPVAKR